MTGLARCSSRPTGSAPRRVLTCALTLLLALAGRASGEPEALRALHAQAQAERQAPKAGTNVKPPAGLEELADPLPEGAGLRDATLDAALARLKPPPAKPAADAVDDATLRQSIRLYVRGQTALVETRFADAVKDLTDAAELNPGAPEPWESLAQAQARSGKMRDAIVSLHKAYETGSSDPGTLMTYWRALRLERHWEDSAAVASRLRDQARERSEVALSVIADAALGESLLLMGGATAGSTLIADALDRSESVSSPRWAEEFAELVRRKAELWTVVGDARLRLNQVPGAVAAYERAAGEPEPDSVALMERRVYALLRSGLTVGAADLVATDRVTSNDPSSARTGSLIRLVATADPTAAGSIVATLISVADDPETTSATRAGRLVRAAAAGLDETRARDLLLARLERTGDPGIIQDLLDRPGADAPEALLALAGEALNRAPSSLDRVVTLVIKHADAGPGSVITARAKLAPDSGLPGADAIVASLLVRAGKFDDAAKAAADADRAYADDPRWLLWRTKIGAACADWNGADRAARALAATVERDPRAAPLAAPAFAALQRPDDALSMFERSLTAGPPGTRASIDDLLDAADLADWLGRDALSESYIMRAASADPLAETPRLRLLESAGTAPEPDRERLSAMIRELREIAPRSRGLRLIRARELLRARQYPQALSEYSALLSEDPDDDDAGKGLLTVAMSLPTTDPALSRLRTRVSQLGDAARASPWPGLADAALGVRFAKDDAAKSAAAGTVEDLFNRIYDGEVLRLWGALTREALGPDAGSRRVLDKLAKYPANADVAAARAAAHAHLADAEAVVADLGTLPPDLKLRPAQAVALLAALERPAAVAVESLDKPNPAGVLVVRRALESAFVRAGHLSPELHAARLKLMVADREFDMATLVHAAADAAAQVPAPGAVYPSVIGEFGRQGMAQAAVEFCRLAAADEPPGNATLHVLWLDEASKVGSAEDSLAALRAACAPDRFEATAREIAANGDAKGGTSGLERADLAYITASRLASRGLDDAVIVYEQALVYDPDHRPANNDLGYTLLEHDQRRDDAARFIENAFRLDPNDVNVMDSIGWLRYLQGRFSDDQGGPGAVSLLKRAVAVDTESNPTLRDHLGDALFRAGDSQGASASWHEAEGGAASRSAKLHTDARDWIKRKYSELQIQTHKKWLAAREEHRPAVAPTWAEIDQARKEAPPGGGTPPPAHAPGAPDGEKR
jgi:tetratricopeptide (TPR) repeat protein